MPRAVVVEKPGGYDRLVLQDAPSPPLKTGEVRVHVRAAGVNYADALVRMGVYAAVKSYPIVPGFEFAGEAADGRHVFGVTRFGGYASEVAVPESQLWPVPKGWSFEQAAAFPAVHMTAYHGLLHAARLVPNEKVLVHSAAGGVGTAAVRIAKILGCAVAGVVGAPHKVEACRALGADLVIDKSSEDLWKTAERFSPAGYDVILDPNGYTTLKASYRHLAKCGRLLIYGFASMLPRSGGRANWLKLAWDYLRTPRFDPLRLCSENKAVIGFNVVHLFDRADLLEPAMATLLGWTADGRLPPPPVAAYPFEEAARAHRDLESGRTVGKLVLSLS